MCVYLWAGAYATADNTAQGSDYTAANSTVNFLGNVANETQTISIIVSGDELVELDESFLLTLTNILNTSSVQFADSTATGTIDNDDAATLTINDVTLAEGNSGTTTFTFNVTLSAAVDTGLTVNFGTVDDSATTNDSDYTADSGTLTFVGTANESMTIDVLVTGDTTREPDEAFMVALSALSADGRNVTIPDMTGIGTITDDDRAEVNLSLNVSAYNGSEAENVGNPSVITITATATTAVSGDQTFTVDVSGLNVTSGDYVLTSQTITIPDGQTQGSVVLNPEDDSLVEATETVTVALTNPSSGVKPGAVASATFDITNNDAASLTISDATVVESNAGTTTLTFNVTNDSPVDAAFTVDFNTADGTATVAEFDYIARSGTLTFDGTPNQTLTVSIDVTGDVISEVDETLLVN